MASTAMHPLLPLFVAGPLAAAPTPALHPEYNTSLAAQLPLEQGWENPPRLARTRVWWWWLNGRTTKAAITRDLTEMKAKGIGGANIIDAGGDDQRGNRRVPHGPDFGTPAWRELFVHALAEAARLDLELGFNITSGWNLGGPLVTPDQAAQRLTHATTTVDGGRRVELDLAIPPHRDGYYRDIAVLAVPAPEVAAAGEPAASSQQAGHPPAHAFDGDPATFWVSRGDAPGQGPAADRPEWLEISGPDGLRADRLLLTPRAGYGPKRGVVQAIDADPSAPRELARFEAPAEQPVTIRFPATTARRFRLVCLDAWDPRSSVRPRNVQVAGVALFDGARQVAGGGTAAGLLHFEQKAYYQYPGQFTATEAWHLLDPGPDPGGGGACMPGQVLDLTGKLDARGRLAWDAPAGKWKITRLGHTFSGAHVSTHSEGWGGRAIDYLDRDAFQAYWGQVMEPILADSKPFLGKSLRFLHTDSWELGPVNWTKRLPAEFHRLRGYDITPWLPVLTGTIVGSRELSTRFLNDFRRTLADLMAENKYVAFSGHAHAVGCGIHPESGGPHAGPMDALLNLGISDVPMGEFWAPSPTHRVHDHQRFFVKQTTSAAHVYGRRVSLAEAFTTIGTHWQESPRSLKPTFDRAACEGHNLTMWHTFDCSPVEDGLPGSVYFAGSHFNPNVTWWPQAHAFTGYLNRCHFLLQQGLGVADVLHFYGENIPAFVRLKRDDPAQCLPGHDYDVIDLKALLTRTATAPDGRVVLPDGTAYQILSLTPHDALSLPALQHLARLVEQGATLVGPRPQRQFSLTGTPASDRTFAALCDDLWGAAPPPAGEQKYGKGRICWGRATREVLAAAGTAPDFTWLDGDDQTLVDYIHRRTDDAEIYFVANRNNRPEDVELAFRVAGRVPELWDPVSGERRELTRFHSRDGRTFIPFPLAPEQACFFLFRKPAAAAARAADDGPPNVPAVTEALALTGPWRVAFDPAWGGPAGTTFERLLDWTTHPDEGIRHYSGAATYSIAFDAPAGLAAGARCWLDLGTVHALAEVTLNGQPLGILWATPPRAEISRHLKPAANRLEVKVVNLWPNRLIGDAKLPPAQRRTRTNVTHFRADSPLEPSGLLGPVRLLQPQP